MRGTWFLQLGHGSRLLLVVASALVVVICVMMCVVPSSEDPPKPLLGALKVKPAPQSSVSNNTSNYQTLRKQQRGRQQEKLRYQGRKSLDNPFLSLYQEAPRPSPEDVAQEASPSSSTPPQSFFSVVNSDRKKEATFFEAVFEETQPVQDGKALKIVLKNPIPALNLEADTILKGVPYLEGGTRLKIRVTAAIVGDTVRPIHLVCFDKADCLEGLYHEALAQQLAGTREGRLLEKVLDLYTGEGEKIVREGKQLVRKFSDLLQVYKSGLVIEKGRALFVALPSEEE